MNGLPGGAFTYFKTDWMNGKLIDTWREVEIDPYYAYIAWGGGAEFPHPLFGWRTINLDSLNINAEEAIKIAEDNGGQEARLRVQNKCNIHLMLMPELFHGWVVDYQSAGLEIQIEDYTGLALKAYLP